MKPRVIEVNGLPLLIPTWDPTPVEWNRNGSWAKDPVLEEEIRAGIRDYLVVVTGFTEPELVEEAVGAVARREPFTGNCGTYWGSHGCHREPGHHGLCVCRGCSALFKLTDCDPTHGRLGDAIVWWNHADDDEPMTLKLGGLHWNWYQ